MQYTSSLVLAAAFASCCVAQKNAAEAVESIDSITQGIIKVEGLINSVSAENPPEAEAETAPLLQWRDFVVAENNFIGNASSEIKSTATKEEGEQICVSQNKSIEKHILLLDTLIAKHDEFSANFHNVATAVLKLDEDAVDTMAVLLRDMVPLCEMKNLEDFTDKFDTAIEKYSAP